MAEKVDKRGGKEGGITKKEEDGEEKCVTEWKGERGSR